MEGHFDLCTNDDGRKDSLYADNDSKGKHSNTKFNISNNGTHL